MDRSGRAGPGWTGPDRGRSIDLLANVLDSFGRAENHTARIQRASAILERASAIARELGPQWELVSTRTEVLLALNAGDWRRAAAGVDAVEALRAHGTVGKPSPWMVWTDAVGTTLRRTPLPSRAARSSSRRRSQTRRRPRRGHPRRRLRGRRPQPVATAHLRRPQQPRPSNATRSQRNSDLGGRGCGT